MRFWIISPRIGWFRRGVSFGADDFRRRRQPPAPFIVTEQRAEPVELVYQSFRRLDPMSGSGCYGGLPERRVRRGSAS
jgi:hypothetical protein